MPVKRSKPTAYPQLPVSLKDLNVLALDLGRRTGWCHQKKDGTLNSGVHELYSEDQHKQEFEDGLRFMALRHWFVRFGEQVGGWDVVAFEQVPAGASMGRQRVLYPSMRAVIMAECAERGILCVPIPVGTWKVAYCGNGNANKDKVMAESSRRGFSFFDDNESDALGIFHGFKHLVSVNYLNVPARVKDAKASRPALPEFKKVTKASKKPLTSREKSLIRKAKKLLEPA
jgi:hypothetical protein